jgi:hypothetical protein
MPLCALAACGEVFVIRATETKRPLFYCIGRLCIECCHSLLSASFEDKLTIFDQAGFEQGYRRSFRIGSWLISIPSCILCGETQVFSKDRGRIDKPFEKIDNRWSSLVVPV